ncbi:DNA polymerase epsilon subunit 3-like [Diabrotica virgifera virgifera]|uniref:DNA polymerase epsilon subunit 3 n=1 Tax=Diabrotica virgifera virgifera TaxID=50390 RepID=A0A6P7H5N1_DIAVI|nr:DNA polymerase epsilon subunit 3-like [Diabrotica virgifera virgifera]
MAERLEDLNLPNNTVQKIIKEALPDSVNIGKDARSALSRAASVFVLYVTSQASNEAQKNSRKTLMAGDVLKALQDLEFENFIEPLEDILKDYKNSKSKKQVKTKKPSGEEQTEMEEGDEIQEVADDE